MTPQRPPLERPERARAAHVPSLVLVNTGDGKGKTTAAMGTVLRAVARGWKVSVIQFIKSGQWRTGEEQIARQLGVEWRTMGDGFSWDSQDLAESAALARRAWEAAAQEISSGDYDLILLDEITYPMNWGWIAVEDAAEVIRNRPSKVNVILTGRDAPKALLEVADTVTEMRKVRHAYDKGVGARRGIDY